MNAVLDVILKEIEGVLAQVKDEELENVMASFSKDRRIFVDGEGRSGFSAKGFAMRLMHLGYTVYFVGETITPAVKDGDLFIAVSGSGKSANVVNDAKKAKAAGAELIAVTSKPESPLAVEAAKLLVIPGTVKGDTGAGRASVQLLSSLFDQSLHITLDALCLLISRRDNTANETATGAHW
ncbi:MAG: 6-phospho-3-hexuloisomerase [Eubacteriales bacterium]|nr:6-phospho-3-hexuloisomerase [Eubacteriales bacterium]